MGIPNRQIGWSQESNLLWQISKQLEKLTQITANNNFNVTAYSQSLTFPITYVSINTRCDGSNVGNSMYTSATVNDITELVTLFNSTPQIRVLGRYSALGTDVLVLNTTGDIKNTLCPTGTLSLYVYSD